MDDDPSDTERPELLRHRRFQKFGCWDLGGTVAPNGVKSCKVKPGTKIFVAANSVECSTFEGNGTTEAELRTCARAGDVHVAPSVTVDGTSVPVTEVETRLLNITLPADPIPVGPVGGPPQPGGTTGQSVAHGWVTLLNPLTKPGSREIHIVVTNNNDTVSDITTKIVVQGQ